MAAHSEARAEFQSRQYAYKGPAGGAMSLAPELVPGTIYRFLMGRDRTPQVFPIQELKTSLRDPFAQLVLGRGAFPRTLRDLLSALDAANSEEVGLPEQRCFVVADGGQIRWTPETSSLKRELRLAIARGKPNLNPDLFISTSKDVASPDTFLQVAAWDSTSAVLQFYDRRGGAWIWAGNTNDALAKDTRGQGPFDSHVNGVLNMKELKFPWINWHSQAAAIQDSALAPEDPFLMDPLWVKRRPGEEFEMIIRAGIRRLTDSRFSRFTANGRLTRLPDFMRQVLETTTINLTTSSVENATVAAGQPVDLPRTFFCNTDGLSDVLGLDPGFVASPTVDGSLYAECLKRFAVETTDGVFHFRGDTHFVFVVPEPAFEDIVILEGLMNRQILGRKMAASLLMVDFSNAVFSPRRAALLRYVPDSASIGNEADFNQAFVSSIEAVEEHLSPDAAEHEFLANWRLPDLSWQTDLETKLKGYATSVQSKLGAIETFVPIFELAESRRREFRRRPLAEFRLTTPISNIPEDAPVLEITPQGTVQRKILNFIQEN
ncbi:MAG: hypothetical protein WB992_12470 [Bryobacteraceae bacterium]